MRILSIDPGSKFIGLAISDLTGSIANPLERISHRSYREDAVTILQVVDKYQADEIIIGQSFNEDGEANYSGRLALRLANAIKGISKIPICMWDEAFTTQEARAAKIIMGSKKKNRRGHHDSLAATVLLQSYLNRNP